MPYAHGRLIHDAYSHVMEPGDWLDAPMDGALKTEFPGKPASAGRADRATGCRRPRPQERPAPVPA